MWEGKGRKGCKSVNLLLSLNSSSRSSNLSIHSSTYPSFHPSILAQPKPLASPEPQSPPISPPQRLLTRTRHPLPQFSRPLRETNWTMEYLPFVPFRRGRRSSFPIFVRLAEPLRQVTNTSCMPPTTKTTSIHQSNQNRIESKVCKKLTNTTNDWHRRIFTRSHHLHSTEPG